MKLNNFIKSLEEIIKNIDDKESVDVRMADYIPVSAIILKDGNIFITDQKR